jgi:phage portal protein BeeE
MRARTRSKIIRCSICSAPSLDHTGTDFLEAWYGFLLVAGNAYAEAVVLDGDLRELHILRPDRMKVIPGLDGWPEGQEHTACGRSVRFVNDVIDGAQSCTCVSSIRRTITTA